MIQTNLQYLLEKYIQDPTNPEQNWDMGLEYFNIGQTASAVSFFLRCAERTEDTILQYECLLKIAESYKLQGGRSYTVESLIKQALALVPTQPEAYFMLSELYQQEEKWLDGYTIASVGEVMSNTFNYTVLRNPTQYPGKYGLIFLKAVNGWWSGFTEESGRLLRDLVHYHPLNTIYKNACRNNFNILNIWKTKSENGSYFNNIEEEIKRTLNYSDTVINGELFKLKIPFKNSDKIEHTYSEFLQDLFVLTVLDGKTEGIYVELGAGYPFYGNNTALLETKYNWKGVSVDLSVGSIEEFFRERNNVEILADATTIDYVKVFNELKYPTIIDYLQIDCDPSEVSFNVLKKIPFDVYDFKVITFEHDHYQDKTSEVRKLSRKLLTEKGYTLVVSNVGRGDTAVEDWWVNPKHVDIDRLKPITHTSNKVKCPKNIFLS